MNSRTAFKTLILFGLLGAALSASGQAYDLEDFETGDFSANPWVFGGVGSAETWTVTTPEANSGSFSAVAPAAMGDLQSVYMEVTVNVTANNQIAFAHKESCEAGFDFLYFYIDGQFVGSWSGITGWSESAFGVFAGSRTFRWEYFKDSSVAEGLDIAWVDDIRFTGETSTDISVVGLADFIEIVDGGSFSGFETAEGYSDSQTLVVRNIGTEDLLQTQPITITGPDASAFSVAAAPAFPIGTPYLQEELAIDFSPSSPGSKTATLTVHTNDPDEADYEITLSGVAYSFTADADSDGLSDGAEFQLADLGFDLTVSQPALVNLLLATVADEGFGSGGFTVEDVANFYVGTPNLQADPGTGLVTLTIAPQATEDLNTPFAPFPASPSQVSVNGSGEIEFEFPMPEGQALFLLLESQ